MYGRQADDLAETVRPSPMRPIPARAMWLGAAVLILVAIAATWILLASFGGGTAQDRTRLQAIRLAGGIVVGTAGTSGLILAARRQRATELGLLQQERAATESRHDAEKRRVHDLQASAGEQLGSDKAAVRLNGLYQLEHLGEDHPDHRQVVVDVLCAYLRMPFIPPDKLGSVDETWRSREELQVRRTAQRILTAHLRPVPVGARHRRFWRDIDVDLAGAVLVDFDMTSCHVRDCDFEGAEFHGNARFDRTVFHGECRFTDARFHGTSSFLDTRFHGRNQGLDAQPDEASNAGA